MTSRFLEDNFIYAGHPRPDWARKRWISLDGHWQVEHRRKRYEIQVPFPIGSAASGMEAEDHGIFLYRREFDLPTFSSKKKYFLHFGACDYHAEVYLNNTLLGEHTGGYTSFCFEASKRLRKKGNLLVVRVRDSRDRTQIRGKQTYKRKPFSVWYRGIAGIWQSVWLEETGHCYLNSCCVKPDFAGQKIVFHFIVGGATNFFDISLVLRIRKQSGESWSFSINNIGTYGRAELSLSFKDIDLQMWSPRNPSLYASTYSVIGAKGEILDSVESYFGIRELDWDPHGIRINGKSEFLKMVLLQGYYPEGLYTPLHYRVMEDDLCRVKELGFNGVRIHQKVECPYFHYICDTLGLLTTYEVPSFYRFTNGAGSAYRKQLAEIVKRDGQHPSGIFWILFNESWGIEKLYKKSGKTRKFVSDVIDYMKSLDGSRPIIDNSGWEHIHTDIVDIHHYLSSGEKARNFYRRLKNMDRKALFSFSPLKVKLFYLLRQIGDKTRAVFLSEGQHDGNAPWMVSEYGGFGWYKMDADKPLLELIREYTKDILDAGIFSGYCYTQLYDVEAETNGLLTFHRVPKIDIKEFKKITSLKPKQTLSPSTNVD